MRVNYEVVLRNPDAIWVRASYDGPESSNTRIREPNVRVSRQGLQNFVGRIEQLEDKLRTFSLALEGTNTPNETLKHFVDLTREHQRYLNELEQIDPTAYKSRVN